jgi:hypothetical protein
VLGFGVVKGVGLWGWKLAHWLRVFAISFVGASRFMTLCVFLFPVFILLHLLTILILMTQYASSSALLY